MPLSSSPCSAPAATPSPKRRAARKVRRYCPCPRTATR
jgi:hypothetical protein